MTDRAQASASAKASDVPRQEILLAEDDPTFRTMLRNWLSKWGYAVIAAGDGNEAWEILQQDKAPHLVILDWMMPGIDGLELCHRIRATERAFYQYVLLVTAKDNTEDVVTGLEAGADDYLTKPFAMGELRARLVVGKRILALQDKLIQAQEDLRFRATHDALTGIWNRVAVLDLLERSLEHGRRSHSQTGLLIIDLDRFKVVNDTFGHVAGDAVLQEAARRITHSVRPYDFAGRYGGEEFLVVLSECNEQNVWSAAERIRLAVCNGPIRVADTDIHVTASLGAAVAAPSMTQTKRLLQQADSALYQAKNAGRNRTQVFTPSTAEPGLRAPVHSLEDPSSNARSDSAAPSEG